MFIMTETETGSESITRYLLSLSSDHKSAGGERGFSLHSTESVQSSLLADLTD